MRRAATLLATVALAGCGDDGPDGGEEGAEPVTAAAFADCFSLDGHEASRPETGEESVYSYAIRAKGFEVESINVRERGSLLQSALLTFFADEAERERATKELPPRPVGSGPPALVRGNVVVGFFDEEERETTGAAVERCLP